MPSKQWCRGRFGFVTQHLSTAPSGLICDWPCAQAENRRVPRPGPALQSANVGRVLVLRPGAVKRRSVAPAVDRRQTSNVSTKSPAAHPNARELAEDGGTWI